MATALSGLPPLPPGYWDNHQPLMSELDALLKLPSEPNLTYQVYLVARQAIHTLALGIFATLVLASGAREKAWKDFAVSAQLTKAAWIFLRHFKSLLLIMADNYLKAAAPIDEKNSKNLLSKFLPFLLEMKKHATSPEDAQAIQSIEKSLKDHQTFVYDRGSVPVICHEEVLFFAMRGSSDWETYLPDFSYKNKLLIQVTLPELHALKIIETIVNPSDKDIYSDVANDHPPEIILKALEVAEQRGDIRIIDFARRYAQEWNNRFDAVINGFANDTQKTNYQTQLAGHESEFKKLFKRLHLPYCLILWDSLPNVIHDPHLQKELTTKQKKHLAIVKIVENCPTYQAYQKAIESLVHLGLYDQFVCECPQALSEIETQIANPSFLPRKEARWIIKYHTDFHLKALANQEQVPRVTKERLIFLISAAENHSFGRLVVKIRAKILNVLNESEQKQQQLILERVRTDFDSIALNKLLSVRAERMERIQRSLPPMDPLKATLIERALRIKRLNRTLQIPIIKV